MIIGSVRIVGGWGVQPPNSLNNPLSSAEENMMGVSHNSPSSVLNLTIGDGIASVT